MNGLEQSHRERLKLAMLDSQENLLDFFTKTSLEPADMEWLDVQVLDRGASTEFIPNRQERPAPMLRLA